MDSAESPGLDSCKFENRTLVLLPASHWLANRAEGSYLNWLTLERQKRTSVGTADGGMRMMIISISLRSV